jgi:hypothetical protein
MPGQSRRYSQEDLHDQLRLYALQVTLYYSIKCTLLPHQDLHRVQLPLVTDLDQASLARPVISIQPRLPTIPHTDPFSNLACSARNPGLFGCPAAGIWYRSQPYCSRRAGINGWSSVPISKFLSACTIYLSWMINVFLFLNNFRRIRSK